MLVTAESVVAALVAIDKEFNKKHVILARVEDNYTECMSCARGHKYDVNSKSNTCFNH